MNTARTTILLATIMLAATIVWVMILGVRNNPPHMLLYHATLPTTRAADK
jgi:hypothetical protein